MKLTNYLKDKLVHLILFFCLLISIEIVLILFDTVYTLQVFIYFLLILFTIIIILYDYNRKKSFYNDMKNKLDSLDDKFLIIEMLERPTFIEGKYLYDSLVDICKSMNDKIEEYVRTSNELKRYIETWVHEIKIPIFALKLLIHNHHDNASRKLKSQLIKIDSYVEQVLYYIRSEVPQNDYIIGQYSLKKIVDSSINANKDSLILNHFSIIEEIEDTIILTDEKWLSFMIGQIINNAIKYANKNDHQIIFSTKQLEKKVKLIIEDNGIGIIEEDLPRVFEKSFTGYNGRTYKASTGMGLYLCKSLCLELGHDIEIESVKNKFTRIIITLQK